jgi:hypothetical protein
MVFFDFSRLKESPCAKEHGAMRGRLLVEAARRVMEGRM